MSRSGGQEARTELEIRVQPRAERNEIVGYRNDRLVVRVTAPPEGGKANAAACRLIAKMAGVAKSRVTVIRGMTSRDKLVEVRGDTTEWNLPE